MINQTHYVIDLETLGKGPRAAIAAIGCVEIHHGVIRRDFYLRVNIDDAMRWGGETDASTIQWWLRQDDYARAEIDGSQETESLWNALGFLKAFMGGVTHLHEILVWGNGATFDNVILASAYAAFHEPQPWAYWNDRDLRTLLDCYPEARDVGPFEGTRHHALHDACHEAKQLCQALRLHAARQVTSEEVRA